MHDWSAPRFVYFARAGTQGPIKIGVTDNLGQRLRGLQTGCPEPIQFLVAVTGDADLEKHYHVQFRRWRMKGEWFSPCGPLWAEIHRLAGLPQAFCSEGMLALKARYDAEQRGAQLAMEVVADPDPPLRGDAAADMAAAILGQLRGE